MLPDFSSFYILSKMSDTWSFHGSQFLCLYILLIIRKHTAKIFKLFAYVNFFYLLCNVVITGRLYNEHRPNHKSGMHGRPYSRKMAREAVFVVDFFVALSGEVL